MQSDSRRQVDRLQQLEGRGDHIDDRALLTLAERAVVDLRANSLPLGELIAVYGFLIQHRFMDDRTRGRYTQAIEILANQLGSQVTVRGQNLPNPFRGQRVVDGRTLRAKLYSESRRTGQPVAAIAFA